MTQSLAATVSIERALLPRDVHYRPISRRAWYGRRLPLAFVTGLGLFGVFFLLLGALGGAATWWALLALYGAVFVRLFSRRRRIRGLLRDHDEGLALLAAGELERAREVFEGLCRRGRSMPSLHSLFVYYRGVVALHRGQHEDARGMFLAVLDAGWLSSWASMLTTHHPRALLSLATCEVLRGDVDAAAAWRARAHAKMSPARRPGLLLIDALIGARRGDHGDVVRRIDAELARAENLLSASQLRALRLVKAFALERLAAGRYRDDARDQEIRQALDGSRPFRPGEFDYLATRWPELAEFLSRHGFLAAPTGAPA